MMSSLESLNFLFLATGFTVGFGHCIGMCGPIVVSLSLNLGGRSVILPQMLYNLGRITTYVIMGGMMGLTGSFTMVASKIAGFQRGVLILAGVIIALLGLALGRWIPFGGAFPEIIEPKGMVLRGFRKLTEARSVSSYLPLGLLLGLLPCGPVYTALLASARAGMEAGSSLEGFLTGAGLMFSFGLGTIPSLLLVGKLADLRWLKRRELIYRVSSIFMIGVGIYFIIKGVLY
jgi:sulfite exporter TauE/SafE